MTPEPRGWHERGYLPHFDGPEVAQHLVFRLNGSLPKALLDDLDALKAAPDVRWSAVEDALDAAAGPCWLGEPAVADLVAGALRHFDDQRYRLMAWCIMPNHVHALIELAEGGSLSQVVGSWKSFTAKAANKLLSRDGPFWSADYFDRYIRNLAHLNRTIEYIEDNPVKAGLCAHPADWPWSSAYAAKERGRPARIGPSGPGSLWPGD